MAKAFTAIAELPAHRPLAPTLPTGPAGWAIVLMASTMDKGKPALRAAMPDLGPLMPKFRPWVILLVDDEPDILRTIKTLVEASIDGVQVLTASSGRIGLELLDRERVDLIVSDLRMPGMDGIEFLYQARRHHGNIPRVMLTAFGNEDVARRAIVETFCSAFLSKGVEPEVLIENVTKLLAYIPSSAPPQPLPAPTATGASPSGAKPRPAGS